MGHFVYRLIPPRPTFGPGAMTEEETATMQEHVGYWSGLGEKGIAVVFGPVLDPNGNWGLGVLEAATIDDAEAIRDEDPAVRSGLCTAEILPMAVAVIPGRAT
jgi:uncharacterized protein YciI